MNSMIRVKYIDYFMSFEDICQQLSTIVDYINYTILIYLTITYNKFIRIKLINNLLKNIFLLKISLSHIIIVTVTGS